MRSAYWVGDPALGDAPEGIDTWAPAQDEGAWPQDVACLLIDARHPETARKVLVAIRQRPLPAQYLCPAVWVDAPREANAEFMAAADGAVAGRDLAAGVASRLAADFDTVHQWVDRLPDGGRSSDTNVAFKVLRFMASRGAEQVPVQTVRSHIGFSYPGLQGFFRQHDSGLLDTLDFLAEQNLVGGRFVTKNHFCSHCECAFLSFKECCPQCGADDLRLDELVHHFRCAYVGELAQFRQGDALVCPKCERGLKHIGVDYDKPSVVFHCNQCNHGFQDPAVMTTCFQCGRSTEPENQVTRTLQAYKITAIGENAASHGLESLFSSVLESELRLYSYTSFIDFVRVEAARIERYKVSQSSLVLIDLQGLEQLYIRLGRRAQEVFGELSAVFKTVLRRSDVITARNESVFAVVLTETSPEHAERAVERLREGMAGLLENNLARHLKVQTLIEPLGADTDPDALLEQFLARSAA